MNNARETIYDALRSKLQAYAPLMALLSSPISRRLLHWQKVDPPSQPAVFITQVGETAIQHHPGVPLHWDAHCKLWVYVNVGNDPNVTPTTTLNAVLDQIENALRAATPGNQQTLGGLVSNCRIEGEIITDEGTLGPQAVAIVPIKIVTTSGVS